MADLQSLIAEVHSHIDEIVKLEQALVRIPSVNTGFMPTGDETPVAEFCQKWFANEGIDSKIMSRDPERGNIIAVIPGDKPKTRLMLMSHTDVVPVEDDTKWNYEPFGAEISAGRVYGRGASDCKALLSSQMMAMAIMKRAGVEFEHGLRLVSGADEEHGGRWGFGWLMENHPEELESEFAVNEGGGMPIEDGGNLSYLLNTGEKGRLEVHITVRGSSAHASVPWTGENASFGVAEILKRIEAYEPERDTSLEFFNHLSAFAIEDKPTAQNIDSVISEVNERNPRLASMMRALSRMTLTPTMMSGGVKSNSVPETIKITCDVRTLPFQDDNYLRTQLDAIFEGMPNVEYDIDYMAVPNNSDFDTELMDAIREAQALAVSRDDITWVPGVSNGFTDSRFTRPLGIVTYGFAGHHPDDDPMLSRAHGTDESVGISSLVSSTKAMIAIAWQICNAR
jgi:acetylornithine deacetylase/succinyl-diaminopimelate desuccinylase-like protein